MIERIGRSVQIPLPVVNNAHAGRDFRVIHDRLAIRIDHDNRQVGRGKRLRPSRYGCQADQGYQQKTFFHFLGNSSSEYLVG